MSTEFAFDGSASSKSTSPWREEGGVIYFSVTSDGTTGDGWIRRLRNNNFRLHSYAKQVLCSPDFKPTSGVTTEVAVLKGVLFEDNDRTTEKVCAEADKRNLLKSNVELACLIRDKFMDKDIKAMGLSWIVAICEPFSDSDDSPVGLMGPSLGGVGGWFCAGDGHPLRAWPRDSGFAFVLRQVGY